MKCWAGWITSWNQDFWEKYQQPQINRWYYPNVIKQRGTKGPLEGERGGEKAGLKFSIQKTEIIASSPITSWQIDGEAMEAVNDFIFLGFKITADGDCSHELKRRLLLGRTAMTNLESVLKSRNITLLTKVHLVKAMVFSSSHVWMLELDHKESWALKNWFFQTVVVEKTLESLGQQDQTGQS